MIYIISRSYWVHYDRRVRSALLGFCTEHSEHVMIFRLVILLTMRHPIFSFAPAPQQFSHGMTWTIFLFQFLICCLAFVTFAVKPELPQNRLQLSFTLVLTAVAFKFVVNQCLPKISYLTYLVSSSISVNQTSHTSPTQYMHQPVLIKDLKLHLLGEFINQCLPKISYLTYVVSLSTSTYQRARTSPTQKVHQPSVIFYWRSNTSPAW